MVKSKRKAISNRGALSNFYKKRSSAWNWSGRHLFCYRVWAQKKSANPQSTPACTDKTGLYSMKLAWLQSRPRALCACRGERSRALGNPGTRFSLIGFSKKTIKVFLIGPYKFARERLNMRRVWRMSGFFPRNVQVNTTGWFLISAIPKQHLHD